jgi:TPR repeat protein
MYANGQNLPKDDAQAVSWFRQAADQGHATAHWFLAHAYFTGQGVPQDYVEAHQWHNLAASRASAENQTRHAKIRDALATLMTPAQVAEAQKLAREWQTAFDAPRLREADDDPTDTHCVRGVGAAREWRGVGVNPDAC